MVYLVECMRFKYFNYIIKSAFGMLLRPNVWAKEMATYQSATAHKIEYVIGSEMLLIFLILKPNYNENERLKITTLNRT